MDLDPWGPSGLSDSQVVQDGNCYMELGWMCDFRFGYGFDAMEEDALNEKCCVQVLRILNMKADTEIDELERDLVYLQSELAWAEYDDWSRVCCSALRKKIECLDLSIRSLRNENDVDIHLIIHREPAERIHEILKTLLDDYCCKKDEQESSHHTLVSDLPPASPHQELEVLDENGRLSDSGDAEIILDKEMKGPHDAPLDNSDVFNSSLQPSERNTNDFGTVQLADVNGKGHPLHSLEPAAGHSVKLDPVTLESTGDEEVKGHDFTAHDKQMLEISPLKSIDEKKGDLERTKTQLADVNGKDPCLNSLESAAGHSVKKTALENIDFKSTGNGEVKEDDSTANHEQMFEGSPLKSTEGKHDLETANTQLSETAKFSSTDALKYSVGFCHNHNISASESIIIKEEAEDISSLSMIDNAISNYPTTAHDINPKPTNAIVKDSHACIIGNLNEIKKLCKTDLRPNNHGKMGGCNTTAAEKREALFIQATSGNSGIEQKLCDFAANAARKKRLKESKVASVDKMNSSNSILKVEGMKKNTNCHTSHVSKVGQAGLTLTEHTALSSLSALQDKTEKLASMVHLKENKKLPNKEVQMVEIAVNDGESILNLSLNQSRKKAKRIVQSNSASAQSPSFLSTGNVSRSSSDFKTKKQTKNCSNANLKNSSRTKITKRVLQHRLQNAEEQSAGLDDSRNSSKKRKTSTSVPILLQMTGSSGQIEFSEGHGNPVISESKNDLIKESCSHTDPGREVVALKHSATTNLNSLKISDLRAIAKEHKLTNYYKLKKTDLIQQLINRLSCC